MIPASIRNANPGAMYPGPSGKKFGSKSFETLRSKDGVHKIATFPTHLHGAAAQFHLLDARYTGLTIEKAITKWCGSFYASTYLKVLEQKAGIKATDQLTTALVRNHETAVPIARAMAWQEAGTDYPLTEQEWVTAHTMAFGAAVAPEWTPTNDVPTPKPETRRAEIAKTVGKVAGAAAGGATLAVPVLPAPPDLSNALAWKSVILTGAELSTWAMGSWPLLVAAGGVYVVVGHVLPRLRG